MRKSLHMQYQASMSQPSAKRALCLDFKQDHKAIIESGCVLSFLASLYFPWNISLCLSVSHMVAENITALFAMK